MFIYTSLLSFPLMLCFFPDVQCDVRRADLPDGGSVFCVWLSRPGQQGALLQTDRTSQHDLSGASLGGVSRSQDIYTLFDWQMLKFRRVQKCLFLNMKMFLVVCSVLVLIW